MGTYCPPCQDEFPLMNGFAARYVEDGLVILAIDVKEDEGTDRRPSRTSLNATFPLGPRRGRGRREALGRGRAAGPLLDRQGRDHPGRRGSAGSDPTSWPAAFDDPAGVNVTP